MSQMTEAQRHMVRSYLDAYSDEIAITFVYAQPEGADKIARPEEDRGAFAQSYARNLRRIGKAKVYLA